MAKRYQKDIKVVLPKSDPFRDIAVYGAGEEIIKALGGQLADKGKQPGITPSSNSPYFKKGIKKFDKGGTKWKEPRYQYNSDATYYDPVSETIHVAPEHSNDLAKIEHEKMHHWQNLNDRLRDTDNPNFLRKPSIVENQDYEGEHYHNRRSVEEDKVKRSLLKQNPSLGFTPYDLMYNRAINPSMYNDPSTVEGEGRAYEQYIEKGGKSKFQKPYEGYIKKFGDGGKKKLDTSVNPTKQSPIELHQEIYRKANYTPYVPTPEELYSKASGRIEQSPVQPEDLLMLGLSARNLLKAGIATKKSNSLLNFAKNDNPYGVGSHPKTIARAQKLVKISQQAFNKAKGQALAEGTTQAIDYAYGGPLNNTDNMKKSNKKGQSPRSILSPEQKMAMEFGWGGALGTVLGTGAALGLTALTGGAAAPLIPAIAGAGANIGGSIGSNIEQGIDKNKQARQPQFQQPQYQQALPQQMQFAKGGMLNKRGIPNRGTSEQMPYQTQMQSYPNLEFGNGEQMLAMGGELEDTEFAKGGFLNEPAEGVIERRNKNRSREPQEYATFEENFKHMYAQGGRMGAMGPMDVSKIYYADGGMLNEYNGERHENGGIPMGPNAEVEGGETSMKMGMGGEQDSTYIYSDRLKVPGKNYTFAEASKKIDSKYARRTNDKLSDESKRRELNKLMGSQEQERAGLVNSAYETIAAYGGPIHKYAVGGVDPISRNSYYSGTDPVMDDLMKFNAPTNPNKYMMALEKMHANSDFGDYGKDAWKKADQQDLAFQNEMSSQLDQETPGSPYINLNPSRKERVAANKANKLNQKMKFNPNAYLDNSTPNKSRDFSPAEIDQMMQEAPAKTTPAQYNIPVRGITSQGSNAIPNIGGGRSTVAPDGSVTDEGIRQNSIAPYLGYGMQALGLGAEAMRLRGKNAPNKAFTMERQVLNADPQLREADISASIANRNIRDLGASTSSGGAMAGYLAAQAGRTRSKADIMSDLQNRQAQVDMTTGQYNAMAGERAYDKNAADDAAQQSAYSKLFGNIGQLGATMTKDYGTRQSENIATAALGTADFDYKRIKGKLVKVPKGTV